MTKEKSGQTVLTPRGYRALLAEIREIVEQGKEAAEVAVGQALVQTYHQIGSRIRAVQLSGNAGYGDAVLEQLASDLGINLRTLQQCVAFARAYPEPPRPTRLRWAHYRELMRVPDASTRAWYEAQAVDQGWSRAKLTEAIRARRVDRAAGAKGAKKRHAKIARPSEATYVYKAQVLRVVDGDTLLLLLDLGFNVFRRQRLRLAAIDAPSAEQKGGEEAARFVREQLAQVEFAIVKTNKIDVYGRYVGHVFYAPDEQDKQRVFSEGRHLNQELVDAGLAAAL